MNITDQLTPLEVEHRQFVKRLVWDDTFDGKFEDKAYAIGVYKQYIDNVKQKVPAEKLLVFDVQEGWEPLSAFLGVLVPAEPFPCLNNRKAIHERFHTEPPSAAI